MCVSVCVASLKYSYSVSLFFFLQLVLSFIPLLFPENWLYVCFGLIVQRIGIVGLPARHSQASVGNSCEEEL